MNIPVFKIFKYSRRASIIAVIGGLIVIFGGSSTYAAHSNALPGSAFYPLKQLWEKAQLVVSFSPAAKAHAQIGVAQDRVKAAQSTPAPTTVLVPALQVAQQQLSGALDQAKHVTDPVQRQEIMQHISDTATEVESEIEHESESETASVNDKQDLKKASDEVKHVQDKVSASKTTDKATN